MCTYDLNFVLRRLKKIQPDLLILMETELWPNTIAACQQQGIKILLANARLSEKSALGYRRIASLSRQMLSAVDAIAASLSGCRATGCSRCRAQLDSSNGKPEVLSRDLTCISVTGITKPSPFFLSAVGTPGRCVCQHQGGEGVILRALSGLMALPDSRCTCLFRVIRNGLIRWQHLPGSRVCSSAQEQVESIARKRRSCWATLWAR